jgi:hypothetical protein
MSNQTWTDSYGVVHPIAAMSTWHLLCTVAMVWRCTAAQRRGITPPPTDGKVVGPHPEGWAEKQIGKLLEEVQRRDAEPTASILHADAEQRAKQRDAADSVRVGQILEDRTYRRAKAAQMGSAYGATVLRTLQRLAEIEVRGRYIGSDDDAVQLRSAVNRIRQYLSQRDDSGLRDDIPFYR